MKLIYKKTVNPTGFTLLELILVMLIITTVLGMASPSLRGFFSSRQLNDTAEQIVVLTRHAKTQAIYESKYYRIYFDLYRRIYWVAVLEESEFRPEEKLLSNTYTLPKDIKITFENFPTENLLYYIEYTPEGYTNSSRIILEDNKKNMYEIVCLSPAENFEMREILDGRIYSY